MTPTLDASALERALGPSFAGRLELHAVLPSTIDRCRSLAEAGAPAGTVVLAEAQSAGRGHAGHRWFSPQGCGLYLSVLLRPALRAEEAACLAPLTALAACESLRRLGVDCCAKLPNDLVAPREGFWRKLGGLLVDTAVQGQSLRHVIASLGLNVTTPRGGFPDELRETAVSCADLGAAPSREKVAAAFLPALRDLVVEAESGATAQDDIRARHAHLVRDVLPGQRMTLEGRA